MTAREAAGRREEGPGAYPDLRDQGQGPEAREADQDQEAVRRAAQGAISLAPSLQARRVLKESREASPAPKLGASPAIDPSREASLARSRGASQDQDQHPRRSLAPDPGPGL